MANQNQPRAYTKTTRTEQQLASVSRSGYGSLRIVLRCDSLNEELATRIGQLTLMIGKHQTALDVLRPWGGLPERFRKVGRELYRCFESR